MERKPNEPLKKVDRKKLKVKETRAKVKETRAVAATG